MDALDQVRLNIKRAKHHSHVLDRNLRSFYNTGPCKVSERFNPGWVWYIRSIEMMREPPPKTGVLVGEMVFNLRAALDHLAWQLALLTTDPPFRDTQFPIELRWRRKEQKHFCGLVRDIPPAAVSVIQAVQPYHRGEAAKEHPLWVLNELCNIAKHVVIPVHSLFAEMKLPRDPRIKGWMVGRTLLIFIPIDLKAKVDLAPRPNAGVAFGYKERGLEVNPRELREIYEFVADDVFPRFTGFFREHGES